MPTTASPARAIITVAPAKTTALPAVPTARAADSSAVHPLGELLLVPDRDEQRVVDADGQADHQAERRGGGGQVDHRRTARRRRPTPTPTPISAVSSGRPAASSEPKVIASTSSATSTPMRLGRALLRPGPRWPRRRTRPAARRRGPGRRRRAARPAPAAVMLVGLRRRRRRSRRRPGRPARPRAWRTGRSPRRPAGPGAPRRASAATSACTAGSVTFSPAGAAKHDPGGRPAGAARRGSAAASSSVAVTDSTPGIDSCASALRPNAAGQAAEQHQHEQPGRQHALAVAERQPPQPVEERGHAHSPGQGRALPRG